MALVNAVGGLYILLLRRYTHRRHASMTNIELTLGPPHRRKMAVFLILSNYVLEACLLAVVPGLAAIGISHLIANSPLASAIVLAVSAFACASPLGLYLGVYVWAIYPTGQSVSYLEHPERLWPASVLAWSITIVAAAVIWVWLIST